MNKIKSLAFVIFLLLVVLVLVITRSTNTNLFKQNSKSAINASVNLKNSISVEQVKNGNYLVIDLDDSDTSAQQFENTVNIPFEHLLNKESQDILKESKNDIALTSSEISTSSKAWVILNQLGFSNVYIIQSDEHGEVLKYKFQPNTCAQLE